MDHKKTKTYNPFNLERPLPVDIVLSPSWWYKHTGITFDEDFFYHPIRRVEAEQKMEQVLYEKWGQFGLGADRGDTKPEIGAVHLAAGFMISEMLGCDVRYEQNNPPQVIPASREDLILSEEDPFHTDAFKRFESLLEKLHEKHGYLSGDVNWGGILNIALDLRGQELFVDMYENPDDVHQFFENIENIIHRFVNVVQEKTGTSSISVNRNLIHVDKQVFLHSECSHTMISAEQYEHYLLDFDCDWSKKQRPFGIHYCGEDPHRFATSFAKIPHLDFLDVGWGGDLNILRKNLPQTFLNIRLSPVEITSQSLSEIEETVRNLVFESDNPWLTGVCCINMDDKVTDDKITAIFEVVDELRREMVGEGKNSEIVI
jgi:hypothetical protein